MDRLRDRRRVLVVSELGNYITTEDLRPELDRSSIGEIEDRDVTAGVIDRLDRLSHEKLFVQFFPHGVFYLKTSENSPDKPRDLKGARVNEGNRMRGKMTGDTRHLLDQRRGFTGQTWAVPPAPGLVSTTEPQIGSAVGAPPSLLGYHPKARSSNSFTR